MAEDSKSIQAAKRLTAAIDRTDAAGMADIFSADAIIWHSTDQIEMSLTDLQGMLGAIASVGKASVEQTSLCEIPGGFLLTLKSTYDLNNGDSTTFHAAMLGKVNADGRITRIDEYLDSAGTLPIMRALS